MASEQVAVRHPFSVIFLLHIALEVPVAIQGLFSPMSLPFLQMNNTAAVFIKLYAALSAGICAACLLCFGLPEFLPGKRALAIGLTIYHVTCSTILYNAPRFIPFSLGAIAEAYKITPENVWGTVHGFIGLGFVIWWQATVQLAAAMRNSTKT
ncbi:uncharacterized protein PHACADRAFT_170797 [Phanerochaete carnosa HHB-10118-sp]|uniref:Uncharacterized protein n=1 Tax=Phanerochaete carnosa (strain HHB-10118-sp) TaxID=650164 RepID=K5V4J9_PHACS|nr:uncharacterized protein PHACADRAFT_170797 [Phanerochaete carnosa HHB-10118-sp]EKM57546.1 hypothetical protein PHACADRAFT_170797 [Phanerochaete carnosa HHB-10118-sp]